MKKWPVFMLSLVLQMTILAQKPDTATLKYENKDIFVSWNLLPQEKDGKYTYHLFIKNKSRGFIVLRLSDITIDGQPLEGIFYGEKDKQIAPGLDRWGEGMFFVNLSFPMPLTTPPVLNGYTRYIPDTSYSERFLVKTDSQVVASSICEFRFANFWADKSPYNNVLIMVYTDAKKDFMLEFARGFVVTKEKGRSKFQNDQGTEPLEMVRANHPVGGLGVPAFFFYLDKKINLKDIEYIDLSNAILPTKRTYAYIHAPLRRA